MLMCYVQASCAVNCRAVPTRADRFHLLLHAAADCAADRTPRMCHQHAMPHSQSKLWSVLAVCPQVSDSPDKRRLPVCCLYSCLRLLVISNDADLDLCMTQCTLLAVRGITAPADPQAT
jgi:hypothetical protein